MTSRFNIRQVVPPERCLSCDVCCRFPEKDSFLAPYFTKEEMVLAAARINGLREFSSETLMSLRLTEDNENPLSLRERDRLALSEVEGVRVGLFSSEKPESGCKINLHPYGEGYICPAFNPRTSHCKIYDLHPIDCKLYPFAVMWNASGKEIVLGMDTKCPYVVERLEDPLLREAAAEVASAIESGPLINIFASNRGLIGPYQDDVFPLVVLKKLTNCHCEVTLR